MQIDDVTATAIYGIYTAAVYLVALPGGWIADRHTGGAGRRVIAGGIVIMSGHFVLAIPGYNAFFLGLLLVILGTGLLKPNVSTIVGSLYPPGDDRRDSGFTIFYMGINLGGLLGPLIVGGLGQSPKTIGWHWGFGAAGVGMLFGVIQFCYDPSLSRATPACIRSVDRRRGERCRLQEERHGSRLRFAWRYWRISLSPA